MPEASWAGLQNSSLPSWPSTVSLLLPKAFKPMAEGRGHRPMGPGWCESNPLPAHNQTFSRNLRIQRCWRASPGNTSLDWSGGILYHCRPTPGSASAPVDMILLRGLTPPWFMGDFQFSPESPISHGLWFISTDTIFLSEVKFWFAFFWETLILCTGEKTPLGLWEVATLIQEQAGSVSGCAIHWKALGCQRPNPWVSWKLIFLSSTLKM